MAVPEKGTQPELILLAVAQQHLHFRNTLSTYQRPCAGMVMATYRERLEQELEGWKKFKEALLAGEIAAFDSMVSCLLKYAGGAEAYRDRRAFDLLVMSPLLSHEERLRELEKVVRMSVRLDSRLDEIL